MNSRDELVELISQFTIKDASGPARLMLERVAAGHLADAIIAAGWRSPMAGGETEVRLVHSIQWNDDVDDEEGPE